MKPSKTLSSEEIKHIARLAKLRLTDEEQKKFQKQISDILSYVDTLNEVDTAEVPATSQVTGQTNVFREDLITPSLSQKEVLANAPDKHKGFFKVKSVLE